MKNWKVIKTIAKVGAASMAVVGTVTGICYKLAFRATKKKMEPEAFDLPEGEIYEPYYDQMKVWIQEMRAMPKEEFWITSHDGLKLHAQYFEYAPGAPIELMFHGYRGAAERDLCGGVQRCFQLGHSAWVVDQRTSGLSEGRTISFGINEHKDCQQWVNFMVDHFGNDVKIILTGISMGASTVLMAAGEELPQQVIGVLADCGFTSAKEIMKKVIKQMKLPATLLYPFVKLAARVIGRYDLEETSAIEAVKRCRIPVIFFHGEADDFVPCEMSRRLYEACESEKRLVTVPGAGHGLSYILDPEGYLQAMKEFFREV